MSSATLSVLGLYLWGQSNNDDLFENMVLPDGIDKEEVVDNILEQCGDFEVCYPSYDYMKFSIGKWSTRWNRTFTKWVEALSLEYNPLHNYDRTEEWTEDETGTGTSSTSGNTTNKQTTQNDNYVTAYNSDELHQKERDTYKGENTNTDKVNSSAETTRNNVKSGRTYGNIGVTTSVQMLKEQMDFVRFNLIQQIVDVFKTEMCILVY